MQQIVQSNYKAKIQFNSLFSIAVFCNLSGLSDIMNPKIKKAGMNAQKYDGISSNQCWQNQRRNVF